VLGRMSLLKRVDGTARVFGLGNSTKFVRVMTAVGIVATVLISALHCVNAQSAAPSWGKVALMGDSNFADIAAQLPNFEKLLSDRLGPSTQVRLFAQPGATIALHGDTPYIKTEAAAAAFNFAPDYAVIMLGSNDGKRQNARGIEELVEGLDRIMERLERANPQVRILLLTPPPAFSNKAGIDSNFVGSAVVPAVFESGYKHGARLLNVYRLLWNARESFSDGVHLTAEARERLAGWIAGALGAGEAASSRGRK
jgi:lysophospholipase L1-like esterase